MYKDGLYSNIKMHLTGQPKLLVETEVGNAAQQ